MPVVNRWWFWMSTTLLRQRSQELFDAQRPVCLNGIDEIGTRGDLRDRAIILHLPIIEDNKRRDEKTFWKNFEEAKPGILGSLLTAVSSAIRNLPDIKLEQLPRMADFARWVVAAEPALAWEPGSIPESLYQKPDAGSRKWCGGKSGWPSNY